MSPLAFLIASLAVWRVTHLIHAEDGPWQLLARLRQRLGSGQLGKMVECFYCLSIWVALPFAAWVTLRVESALIVWLALSGAAVLLERLTSKPEPPKPAWYEEPPP